MYWTAMNERPAFHIPTPACDIYIYIYIYIYNSRTVIVPPNDFDVFVNKVLLNQNS